MEFKPAYIAPFKLLALLFGLFSLSCRFTGTGAQESPIICISFDDGSATVFNNAYPLLIEKSFPATVYVNTGRIGKADYMTVSQLQSLRGAGWEVGGHSLNHEHLGDLSYAEAAETIAQDYYNLQGWGLDPRSFALPYGECPHEYYPLITEFYQIIRSSSDFPLHSPIDPLRLSYTSFQSSWGLSQISARITRGIIDHEDLIILGFHSLYSEDSVSNINCDPQTFAMIIAYLESRDLRVMTISQAIQTLKASAIR